MAQQNGELKALEKKAGELYERESYDSCLLVAGQMKALGEESKLRHALVAGLYYQAITRLETGKKEEAVKELYEGLRLCTDTSENEFKALICNRIGVLATEERDFTAAKRYFKEEIGVRRQMGKMLKTAHCLINLSAMHRRLKEPDSSALVLEEVRQIMLSLDNKELVAYYYNAMGAHYKVTGKLDSAIASFDISHRAWLKIGRKQEAIRPLFNIGLIYHLKKDFKKAKANYLEAKKITEELKLFNEKVTVLGNLSEAYYDLGDYQASADNFRTYIELNDSLRGNEISNLSLKLDKQYKLEKEAYKNEIVKQQKAEIEKQTAEIESKDRRLYLSVILIVVIAAALIILLIYSGFKKSLNARVEEAKKKFFSNVVHEIRTPLSMIKAPVSVLRNKATDPEDVRNLELAGRNIERLNELISQMLDISKIESDKYTLNETFGDPGLFLGQLVAGYSKVAAQKNIQLVPEINIGQRLALFDKDALEKITGNLLGNALKYTAPGGKAGISVYDEDTAQGIRLTIKVWDTGIGIPEKDLENIFNRFYQAQNEITRAGGAGIGLSLVKDLVELQGGTISVESRENEGSTFSVTLFIKSAEDVQAMATAQQPAGDTNQQQVLMVEDDKDILEFNAAWLEKHNFKVIKASGAKEALALLEKNLPDLVISDVMMPDMDGLEFLKRVRSNPASDHIPFIILSAKASAQARMEALQAGAQAYLAKPFIPDELATLVFNQLAVLAKRKTAFKALIEQPETKLEEKFVATEPYIHKLYDLVMKNLDDTDFSVEKLADLMAVNRSHFQRKVKTITGLSPSEIIRTIRLEKAKELLLDKTYNVTEVAFQTGFSSQSYFTRCFTQHFNMAPTEMLRKRA